MNKEYIKTETKMIIELLIERIIEINKKYQEIAYFHKYNTKEEVDLNKIPAIILLNIDSVAYNTKLREILNSLERDKDND